LQETSNFDSESESSDDENESDISFDIQENQTKNDTELITPGSKKMSFANAETRNNTINEYRLQLHQLMNIQSPTSNKNITSPSSKNLFPNNIFKKLIFGSAQRSVEFTDELDSYLDLKQTP
ncbi:12404_t:CDS:2, partial [Dentiscutata heterogama]